MKGQSQDGGRRLWHGRRLGRLVVEGRGRLCVPGVGMLMLMRLDDIEDLFPLLSCRSGVSLDDLPSLSLQQCKLSQYPSVRVY